MSIDRKICPYPGLRPFNEEESIFFKGRDEHIRQVVQQLEAKKFLMLTGASGDGKSSLVYAGVIPNARAGFFKAKYNSWVVADFRPERAPLKNLATAVCRALEIKDTQNTEKELGYGFSALVDTYKSSDFYLDQQTNEYGALDEAGKRKAKRKAANLLILVDQFEEFFTNIENYPGNKPSFAAQAVVNLLLETSRIALEKDLPIYIVCTMRSDYIGQCASFRGLPEYIGFSQFFVPRLNRREIYQVIEEPAILNGDKISKRLIETLISKLDEGIDQLPVLQHALNQVWQCAENGNVEMDLIHFAKVGGLDKKYLNTADRQTFENWLAGIPDYKKPFYNNPSLDNVLDTHANELYELAGNRVNTTYNRQIKDHAAKQLIEAAFKCLTKIDEGRAVRNRMTLQEIAHVINRDDLTTTSIGETLKIFREQGNTFIKPFITDEPATELLQPGSVLDITHESLIRNWTLLSTWASEENEAYQNFLDFNKQLQRWLSNNRSGGYLLPIGPLTFFESWFETAKPNKYWLVKYDERNISHQQKLYEADATLKNAVEFIKKSARKLIVNRTIIKYGANKIIAALGLLLLIVSCTYFTFDFRKKQNGYVIREIEQKGRELLQSKFVKSEVKADFIIAEEWLHPGIFKELLGNFQSDSERLNVVRKMMAKCLSFQEKLGADEIDNPLLAPLFIHQLDLIKKNDGLSNPGKYVKNIGNVIAAIYEHKLLQRTNNHFLNNELNKVNDSFKIFCVHNYAACFNLLNDTNELLKMNNVLLNKFLQSIPALVDYDTSKIRKAVNLITPFSTTGKHKFDLLFPADKTANLFGGSAASHNGGYYQMTNLFACCADFENLNRSFDSLVRYDGGFESHNNGMGYQHLLLGILISEGVYSDRCAAFVKRIEMELAKKAGAVVSFPVVMQVMESIIGNNKNFVTPDALSWGLYSDYSGPLVGPQLEFISYSTVEGLLNSYIANVMNDTKLSGDDKNYFLALLHKSKAFYNNSRGNKLDYEKITVNFEIAHAHYQKISSHYLSGDAIIRFGNNFKSIKRSDIFKYPGHLPVSKYDDTRVIDAIASIKDPGIFANYISSINNFSEFYKDEEILNEFLLNYGHTLLSRMDLDTATKLSINPFLDAIKISENRGNPDKDVINAFLALYYHKINDEIKANEYSKQINFATLFEKEKLKNAGDNIEIFDELGRRLAVYYSSTATGQINQDAKEQSISKTMKVVNSLPFNYLKRNSILVVIDSFQNRKRDALAIILTDTVLNSYVVKDGKFGNKLFQLLGRYGSRDCNDIAGALLKDRNDEVKATFINFFIKGIAKSDNYYIAYKYIPEHFSSSSQLTFCNTILKAEAYRLNGNGWSSLLDFDENSWLAVAYENSENKNIIGWRAVY